MCAVDGEGAVVDAMCQKWLARFLGTVDILVKQFLLWGCLRHWEMFGSTPASAH